MRDLRSPVRLVVTVAVLALCAAALLSPGTPITASAGSSTASVWLQTMDSCEQALGGAQYQIVGDNNIDATVTTRSATKVQVGSGTCPLQQGNCSSITVGCVQFTDLPPGSYRIHELTTPAGDNSNPEGYAACNGGSACQRQEVDLVVSSSGTPSATVTNVYPNGDVATYPTASAHSGSSTYAGTTRDPIVVHNFGLAPPGFGGAAQCDGDSDADDHSTGSPSSRCQYPESQESSACTPFPWSCTLAPWPPVTSTTTTTTTTSSSTSSGTTTSTTTATTDTTTDSTTTDSTTTDSSTTDSSTTDSSTTDSTTTDSTTTDSTTTDSTTTDSSTTSTTTTTTTTTTTSTGCGLTGTATGTDKKGSSQTTSFTTVAAGAVSADLSWTPSSTVRLQLLTSKGKVVSQVTVTGTSLHLGSAAVAPGKYKLSVKVTSGSKVTYTLADSHC